MKMEIDKDALAYSLIGIRQCLRQLPPEQQETYVHNVLSAKEIKLMEQASQEVVVMMAQANLHYET
jgi:hypothetical protein